MSIHVKSGGVWKEITKPAVKVSGTWKQITGGWVKVGGVWKRFFGVEVDTRDIEAGSNNGPFGSGGTETATVIWQSDGTAEGTATSPTVGTTAQYDWLLAGNANQVQIKFTHTTGSAPTGGSALNTWLTLDSNRSLSLSVTNSAPDSGQVSDSSGGTYELQSIGGMSLGGGNWSLSATSDWSSI